MRLLFCFLLLSMLLFQVGCTSQTAAVADGSADANSTVEDPVVELPSESDPGAPSDSEPEIDIPDSLAIGDKAPAIHIAQWATGEGVDGFEDGQVYVVEFWATWCGPCRSSMPHISSLQEAYGEQVKFLGVTREDAETVNEFLDSPASPGSTSSWRDEIKYSLALDKDDLTNRSYMAAAEQGGIPAAFIVGADGYLEWIGHPMKIDDPLKKIVAGDWDRVAYTEKLEKSTVIQEKFVAAMQSQDLESALVQIEELLALDPEDVQVAAMRAGLLAEVDRVDESREAFDELVANHPDVFQFKMMKFNMLVRAERSDEANDFAKVISEDAWDDVASLNELAWTMATGVPAESQDLDRAQAVIERAVELTKHEDPNTLDTLARVLYERGEIEKAVQCQQKAVNLSPRQSLQHTLEGYQAELTSDTDDEDDDDGEKEDADGDADAE